MTRTAKASGDGSFLLPEGCKSIDSMPFDLLSAIEHAFMIIGWQENLLSEDMPPRWMWAFDDELGDWFEAVKARRDLDESYEESSSMTENEYAEEFRRNRR